MLALAHTFLVLYCKAKSFSGAYQHCLLSKRTRPVPNSLPYPALARKRIAVSPWLSVHTNLYIYVQLINTFIKEVIGSRTDIITSGDASNISIMGCYSDSSLYNRILMINPISLKESAKYPKANHKTLKHLIELPIIGTMIYNMANAYNSILNNYKRKGLF